ncbi:tyrosine-type recombinase/integrase [Nitrospirillum amazonense]|uniref:tyrosine-type recombinase/integrase n=1 Tax=Nitrospirillum amazonense TaxID=28077 RepID=UPI002DD44835|nr:tyrosine-type recombinase/integrase [Nitrospirillum amazonense]MEC4590550.1 tyrosine-type recombinase/integrase [Nitrospirillum amazonense]
MTVTWTTAAPGIRYREHPTRRHGVKPDRYYVIRHRVGGRRLEEALGWASEGWTVQKAAEHLVKLKEAKRTGEGETSLRARRERAGADKAAAAKAEAIRQEAEERRARAEKTLSEVWERYLKEIAAVENKPRTVAEKKRIWARRIEPALGKLKAMDVTEDDAAAVVRAPLKLDDAGAVVGGRAEAGNVYRLLHHVLKMALIWGARPRELGNPLENVKEPKAPRRQRLLLGDEVGAILKVLDAADTDLSEPPMVTAVVRLVILTGCRISELLTLTWGAIRFEEAEVHFDDTKTGFSRRPLSTAALELLQGVERMPGVPWVFRSIDDPRKQLSYHTVEKAFRRIRKAAGVEKCSLHTIRHWFATQTANNVSNPRVGMSLTGHRSHAAYMNYVHGDKAQALALADQIAALSSALGKRPEKVVKLKG